MTQDSLPQPGASRRAALAGVGLARLPAKSITVAGGKITLA